jgi:hypothetical protein
VYPSSQIYSSLYFVIELSLCWSCEQWAPSPIDPHRCTRPPSAAAFQAIKMPDRCTAGLIHTREGVRQPRCRSSLRVWHRSAVRAFSGRPDARFRAAITPLSAAVHAGPALPIKDAAMIGNFREECRFGSATFTPAQALIICPLPRRVQSRKCLQIIHPTIFF